MRDAQEVHTEGLSESWNEGSNALGVPRGRRAMSCGILEDAHVSALCVF